MTLNEILNILAPSKKVIHNGMGDNKIESISFDSRDEAKSSIFFAYKGEKYDSNNDAASFYKSGKTEFIIAEKYLGEDIPHAVVSDGRVALAKISEAFYGYPMKAYKSVAVTGTNGKTTTTYILDSIFKQMGYKTVRVGTTGVEVGSNEYPVENTTPSAYDVYKYLSEGASVGCRFVSIEVSSHALAQGRLAGIKFDTAIYTNLSGDHLDFHKDMEHYFLAKSLLFEDDMSKYKIVNTECPYGKRLAKNIKNGLTTFSVLGDADIFPVSYETGVFGIKCRLSVYGEEHNITSHLIGRYNLANIMGAVGAALACGADIKDIMTGVEALENVPGRLEKYRKNGVTVFVDYAHTDDALKNAITALKVLTDKRIITLFGAGGERDKTKRPRMGKVASELSDVTVITSDNPRMENQDEIIKEILTGVDKTSSKMITEIDREKAIEIAINEAKDGDVVLVAGKGHECYQIIGQEKYPFDDRVIVKKYLERL